VTGFFLISMASFVPFFASAAAVASSAAVMLYPFIYTNYVNIHLH